MTRDPPLEAYFAEAASWDADRAGMARRSARIAWGVAAAGWLCAVASSVAIAFLTPLKTVEPFVVRVENSTGRVDVVPVYAGHADAGELVTRYFLTHYVQTCERFNFSTAESDYEKCGAFHTPQRNQLWAALWTQTNPESPLNLYKDGTTVQVYVSSVSFFHRANGVADLAQIRYDKGKRPAGSAEEQRTHWIATVQYAYGESSKDVNVRHWNPLGFKIVDFRPEPEVLTAPRAPSAGTAAGSSP